MPNGSELPGLQEVLYLASLVVTAVNQGKFATLVAIGQWQNQNRDAKRYQRFRGNVSIVVIKLILRA